MAEKGILNNDFIKYVKFNTFQNFNELYRSSKSNISMLSRYLIECFEDKMILINIKYTKNNRIII